MRAPRPRAIWPPSGRVDGPHPSLLPRALRRLTLAGEAMPVLDRHASPRRRSRHCTGAQWVAQTGPPRRRQGLCLYDASAEGAAAAAARRRGFGERRPRMRRRCDVPCWYGAGAAVRGAAPARRRGAALIDWRWDRAAASPSVPSTASLPTQ